MKSTIHILAEFHHRLTWLALSLGMALTFAQVHAQTQITIPYDVIRGPLVVMQDDATGKALPLSPEFTRYNTVITDGFAQVKVTQVFVNHFGKIKDMVYVFPLPHDGAVHGMRMQYKDSLFIAKILEKSEAQRQYDSVVNKGGQGALLLQNRPNVFEQHVANLKQGDSAIVEIEVSMPLKYADGVFEFTMPTMVAQRYGSGAPATSVSGDPWNPPADRLGTSLQFNVVVQTGFPIANLVSPTHAISIQPFGDAKPLLDARGMVIANTRLSQPHTDVVTLKTLDAYPNTDFVLRFGRQEKGQDFSMASNWLSDSLKGYFAFSLYPDPELLTGDKGSMEAVLLVDISGSQGGWPLIKEKQASLAILDKLKATDRLSVMSFNNSVTYCFTGTPVVAATAENIAKARTFINGLSASGGTELLNAVNTTLALPQSGEHQRYYIFFTDGFITDEDAIFSAISNHPSHPVIFTFGAGDNLNRHFLETTAAIGNGFATEFTSSEDVTDKVNLAWDRIASPQLTNLALDFGAATVSDVLTPMQNRLYKGLPYLVYGRYASGGKFNFTLKATRNGIAVEIKHEVILDGEGNISTALPKLWARQKIGLLRVDEGITQKNKNAIIDLSVTYQVLSDYTAFLAIKPIVVTPDNNLNQGTFIRNRLGANLLPWQWQHEGLGWHLSLAPGVWLLDMTILDAMGRPAFTWRAGSASHISDLHWDGRSNSGSPLKPGRYALRIRTSQGVYNLPLTIGN
jgi:Ca-activated chloride channel homolog